MGHESKMMDEPCCPSCGMVGGHNDDCSALRMYNKIYVREPRFDWEFEEQRTNDLEDLVLQLVERIDGLEKSQIILEQERKTTESIHREQIATLSARISELEDKVSQLEQFRSDWETAPTDIYADKSPDPQEIGCVECGGDCQGHQDISKPDPAPDYFKPCSHCGNSTPMTAWCCDTAAKEAQNEALPGQLIAQAIKKAENAKT